MSDHSTEDKPPSTDSAPDSGTIAGVEKAFLRLTFWQTLLSLAGVFTGAVALYAALNESQAVRLQTASSVWPYVQLMINDRDDGDSAYFALSLENVGVGPARMRRMRLTLHGEPMRNWQMLTAALLDAEAELGAEYGKNSVSLRVLAPGQSVAAFQTHDAGLALKMQEAVYSGAAQLSYCYCSIFDDCWLSDSDRPEGEETIQPVTQCPDYGAAGFVD